MKNLNEILSKQGRSKTWLAWKMGVTYGTIYNWCNSKVYTDKWKIEAVARHLDVEPEKLTE